MLSLASVRLAIAALPLVLALLCFAPIAAHAQAATVVAYLVAPLTPINWPFNILGYLASALVFATFWMKIPTRLRQVAIASNVAFIAYATAGHLYPILILHVILLPLNVVRLREIERVVAQIQRAATTDVSADWLRLMSFERTMRAGEYIFHLGDEAQEFFYIVDGTVSLVELDITLRPGDVSGFLGLFSPAAKRTMSARCETAVQLLVMENRDFLKLYYQNPDFGMYLARTITRRFLGALEVARARQVHAKLVEHPAPIRTDV